MSRFIVLLPEVVVGGLLSHATVVIRQLKAEGENPLLVSIGPEEPLAGLLDRSDFRLLPGWYEGHREVLSLIEDSDVLLLSSPHTVMVLPFLDRARSAVMGVHGSPGINLDWLGHVRMGIARAALAENGLNLLVPSERYPAGIADEFGIDVGRIAMLPNAIWTPDIASEPAGMGSILTATRFSKEKLYVVEAAMALARTTGLPLTAVGTGPELEVVRSWLTGLPRAEVIATTDIAPLMACADVVVASGLVAMEACALRRRVAIAAKGGGLGGALTPESWDVHRRANFMGSLSDRVDPAEVWSSLRSLGETELVALAGLVGDAAAPEAMVARIRSALRKARPAPHAALMVHLSWDITWLHGQLADMGEAVAGETSRTDRAATPLREISAREREVNFERVMALENELAKTRFALRREQERARHSIEGRIKRGLRRLFPAARK